MKNLNLFLILFLILFSNNFLLKNNIKNKFKIIGPIFIISSLFIFYSYKNKIVNVNENKLFVKIFQNDYRNFNNLFQNIQSCKLIITESSKNNSESIKSIKNTEDVKNKFEELKKIEDKFCEYLNYNEEKLKKTEAEIKLFFNSNIDFLKELKSTILPLKTYLIKWFPLVLTNKTNELYKLIKQDFEFNDAIKNNDIEYFNKLKPKSYQLTEEFEKLKNEVICLLNLKLKI